MSVFTENVSSTQPGMISGLGYWAGQVGDLPQNLGVIGKKEYILEKGMENQSRRVGLMYVGREILTWPAYFLGKQLSFSFLELKDLSFLT